MNISVAKGVLTIKKFDDISEVHVIVKDDVPVILNQGQSNEENKVC